MKEKFNEFVKKKSYEYGGSVKMSLRYLSFLTKSSVDQLATIPPADETGVHFC